MTRTSATFKFYRGSTFKRTFRLKDTDGDVITLAGATLSFSFRYTEQDAPIFEVVSGGDPTDHGSELTQPTPNVLEFELTITDEETEAIEFDRGNWWINLIVGDDKFRRGHGELEIRNT